jgi:hypothetical protein
VDHATDLDLGRLVTVQAEKGDDLAALAPNEVVGRVPRALAERRVFQLETAAVGSETDCFKSLDTAEQLFVETAGDLELTGRRATRQNSPPRGQLRA